MNFKPHFQWKEAFPMANEVSTDTKTGGIPDFLRKMSTGASFGNIDASDLKPPRLKVLAGQSPEVLNGVPNALPGNFWVTILNVNLGPNVTGTPILLHKSYQVWAPKTPGSEQKGPLATATDGIHWDIPNQSFDVKFPGNQRTYKWKLGRTVKETGAEKFGSSQDDDPSSKPIATLTYDVLWLVDLPNGMKQVVVFTNSKTGIKTTQNFVSTIRSKEVDQFYQRYRIVVEKRSGPTGDPYFAYDYQFAGVIEDENEARRMLELYDSYVKSGFVAEATEMDAPAPSQRPVDSGKPILDDDDIPF